MPETGKGAGQLICVDTRFQLYTHEAAPGCVLFLVSDAPFRCSAGFVNAPDWVSIWVPRAVMTICCTFWNMRRDHFLKTWARKEPTPPPVAWELQEHHLMITCGTDWALHRNFRKGCLKETSFEVAIPVKVFDQICQSFQGAKRGRRVRSSLPAIFRAVKKN